MRVFFIKALAFCGWLFGLLGVGAFFYFMQFSGFSFEFPKESDLHAVSGDLVIVPSSGRNYMIGLKQIDYVSCAQRWCKWDGMDKDFGKSSVFWVDINSRRVIKIEVMGVPKISYNDSIVQRNGLLAQSVLFFLSSIVFFFLKITLRKKTV